MTEKSNKMILPGNDQAAEAKPEQFTTPFHFENTTDELVGIETAVYPNNNVVKRFTLSDGRIAIIRELTGFDMMKIDKLIAGEADGVREDKYFPTLFHFAVKLDGKALPIEDFGKLKGKDYNKIKLTATSLNF